MIPWKRGGARKLGNPEERLHVAVADYLRMALPEKSWFTTIPTVGSSMIQGSRMKRKGYFAGTPDIVILWDWNSYWIELKAPNGHWPEHQRICANLIYKAGGNTSVCRSLEDVQEALELWRIPLRATLAPEPAQVKVARETA